MHKNAISGIPIFTPLKGEGTVRFRTSTQKFGNNYIVLFFLRALLVLLGLTSAAYFAFSNCRIPWIGTPTQSGRLLSSYPSS
jgi:hypothetical protein